MVPLKNSNKALSVLNRNCPKVGDAGLWLVLPAGTTTDVDPDSNNRFFTQLPIYTAIELTVTVTASATLASTSKKSPLSNMSFSVLIT